MLLGGDSIGVQRVELLRVEGGLVAVEVRGMRPVGDLVKLVSYLNADIVVVRIKRRPSETVGAALSVRDG